MPRNSCITHPKKARFIQIRQEYIGICDGAKYPQCAAALLDVFEHWTNFKLDAIENEDRKIKAAAEQGKTLTRKQTRWIYLTQPNIKNDELFELFGETVIAKSIQFLIEKRYIVKRHDPDNSWNRTMQYWLQTQKVQTAITEWEAHILRLASSADKTSIPYQYDIEDLPVPDRDLTSTTSITTQESTQESQQDSITEKETPNGVASDDAQLPAALLSADITPIIERQATPSSKPQFPEKESTMGKIITKLVKEFTAAKKQHDQSDDAPKSPSKAMQYAIVQAMLNEGLWREDSMTDSMYKQAGTLSKTLLKMPKPPTPDEAKDFIAYLAHLSAVKEWGSFSLYKMDKHVPAWRNNPDWRETLDSDSDDDLPIEHQPYKPEHTEPGKYYNLVKERNALIAKLWQLPYHGEQS